MSERCRACGAAAPVPFYRQSGIPTNSCLLIEDAAAARDFPRGELELACCPGCGFIQNTRFISESAVYTPDYEETQAFSPRFLRYVDELIDDQDRRHGLAGRTVLEIGCGKGDFLRRLVERTGARGIGIDPTFRADRAGDTAPERLTFIQDFYGPRHADLPADYVCCRHTLEHIPDVRDFLAMVRGSIGGRPEVVVLFEVPDVERVLKELAFWDVYYEHCSYFSAGSLARLFDRAGFDVQEVRKVYDGQYLVIEARPRTGDATPLPPSLDRPEATLELARRFAAGMATKLAGFREALASWRRAGKRIVLWGSGSKAVAYLVALGLGEEVQGVIDVNPHKAGYYLAGTGHRIEPPERLPELAPDVVIVMNPIYRDEIGRMIAGFGLAPELVALD